MKYLVPGLLLCILILPGGHEAAGQEDLWEREWQQVRTASVRVHHPIGDPVPSPRLRQLEVEVQRIAERLRLTEEQRNSLRTAPIEYLYLPDSSSLRWFGVDDVDGIAFVRERRIIASRLPHEHELAHVLAHIAIAPAPGSNLPWIQEGLASYIGGHLGESPAAILALGDDTLDRNPGLIARILTVTGFRESPLSSEECYSAAARFVNYLDVERGGLEPLLLLLRLLSGLEDEVAARPSSFVEVQLEGVYETSFDELLEGFESWRRALPVGGVVVTAPPMERADIVLADGDHLVRWWQDVGGWVIAVTPLRGEVDVALVWGSDAPRSGTWTAPGGESGYELRITEDGGRFIDHGSPRLMLRWFDDQGLRGDQGEIAWFFPDASIQEIRPPASPGAVTLWSPPRFIVD
jgi:hypothetical protein